MFDPKDLSYVQTCALTPEQVEGVVRITSFQLPQLDDYLMKFSQVGSHANTMQSMRSKNLYLR